MPSTRIETRSGWIGDRHAQVIAAAQRALVEGILIPEEDRCVRILEYPEHAFAAPSGKSANYTIVEISMFAGRSAEAKRRLYSAMSRELSRFGVRASDLKIIIHDVPRENWGLGGKSATDIELSFKIEV